MTQSSVTNKTITKFVRFGPFFTIKTQEIKRSFAKSEKKAIKVRVPDGMMFTVLLHCPEIRTVDSQSDLRILSELWLVWIIMLLKNMKYDS